MATRSIVDFVKDSLGAEKPDKPADPNALFGLLSSVAAGSDIATLLQSSAPPAQGPVRNELAYIMMSAKVVDALRGSSGLTPREIFDKTDESDFPRFEGYLAEMIRRGLIHPTGRNPKYGDPIYSLASPPTS